LIVKNKDTKETLDFIYSCLMEFENYHRAVFEMECKTKLYSCGVLNRQEYQDMISSADENRTSAHNSLLGMVNALNCLTKNNGLPPLYDGLVSEERPFRREVANAVFEYMQTVIEKRR